MRPLITIILGTLVLSACSSAGSPPSPPSTSVPNNHAPSPAPTTTVPPSTAPATAVPSPTPTSDATAVDLADVEIRPITTRPPASKCTDRDRRAMGLETAMTLAGAPISYLFLTGYPRDGSAGGWSDGVPGPTIRFDSSAEHQTMEARAGDIVRFEPAVTVTFIDGRLELYRLDAYDLAGDSLPAATVDLGGDAGGLDVPLPTQAGRWLLNVYAHWQTDCATGDGYVDLLLITR